MPENKDLRCGCLFCKTGCERDVAKRLEKLYDRISAFVALQEKHKSENGKKTRIQSVMLPGYVFFLAPEDMDARQLWRMEDVVRVLTDFDGDWRLTGSDEAFVRWLSGYRGCLGFSRAVEENARVRILSGPLKDMEGKITRVDRRGRSGQVELLFDNRKLRVWLGFELVESMEPMPETDGGTDEVKA